MSRVADQSALDAVRSEGGLLPPDVLSRIAQNDKNLAGLKPADYHLGKTETLAEAITRSWNRLIGLWATFREELVQRPDGDPAQGLTRDRFLLPLFQELGYGRLLRAEAGSFVIDERAFPITHLYHRSPIHLVGAGVRLDTRTAGVAGAATSSPHGLVQDYLNRSDDHLWAFLSNGRTLRVLRDHYSLTRQAYVEFDLESIFEGELFHAFRLLWLVCHQSRVENGKPEHCWLEKWFETARDEGVRALEHLREGVEAAIASFGRGFLAHRSNEALREALAKGELPAQEYYRELLRLVYRLIFLFVAEDRDVLLNPMAPPDARRRYVAFYGTKRVRELARRRRGSAHPDLWEGLKLVMGKLGEGCAPLGLPALGSFLWSDECLPNLDRCALNNDALLEALRHLSTFRDGKMLYPVNWRNVGSEELGSVYESLLELSPELSKDAATFELTAKAGHERKTTGSYYTPSSLVDCLLDSALNPVLDEAMRSADPEAALLDLKVCDPACGSGHFLVAAARRIAHRLARLRSEDEEPSPEAMRHALRDIVGRCVFGVDINPMAVELCKVSLWMEALEPGKPLSFLDSHILPGNALFGAVPKLMERGVPDQAWKPIEGDDQRVASALRKRNAKSTEGQRSLGTLWSGPNRQELETLRSSVADLESVGDKSADGIVQKENRWLELLKSEPYRHQKLVADAWCASFIWPKLPGPLAEAAPTNELWRQIRDDQGYAPQQLVKTVNDLAFQHRFFHWHLAFPQIHSRGGFDAVLGNPPWDSLRFNETEFFASSRPDVVAAGTAAARKRIIKSLEHDDPAVFTRYRVALRAVAGANAFARAGVTYPLCGVGRVNLFGLFAERARSLVSGTGRVGQIVPSGLVTDDSTKLFFQAVVENGELASFYDFENREEIFAGVHRSYKFGLLTLAGTKRPIPSANFVFFATDVKHIEDPERRFSLSAEEIAQLNPETRTCPIFRSSRDADLTKEVYRRFPTLSRSKWSLSHRRLINQSDDSEKFVTEPSPGSSQLYEGKFFHHYDHRWVSHDGSRDRVLTQAERSDPLFAIQPRYWYPESEARSRIAPDWSHSWLLAWRDIARSTDERSFICSIVPSLAVPNTARVILVEDHQLRLVPALLANLCSFSFDFIARQKIGGIHMSGFIVDQLPIVEPSSYGSTPAWDRTTELSRWLADRVVELAYTAWDLEPFAHDVGWESPPFRWDSARRPLLRAEIDACFFQLYGIERDDVEYIMDTFPIVRKSDEKANGGRFFTKDTILDIYDEMSAAARSSTPYQTRLSPPPADPRVAHPPREGANIIPLPRLPRPVVVPPAAVVPDLAAYAASAWKRPHTMERGEIQAAVLAVLKANGAPMERPEARVAALLCLEPHLLTAMLDQTDRVQWTRVVGSDATKAANASIEATSHEWGAALTGLRGRGRILEDLQQNTWALGTGTESIDTRGWPDGRGGFVVNVLRRLHASTHVDAIILKLPTSVQRWLANAA